MDSHMFISCLVKVRDRGRGLYASWRTRLGEEGDIPDTFHLYTIVPFSQVTVDDLMWALVAAAMNPLMSHLALHVFFHGCTDIKVRVPRLLQELEANGFSPDFHCHYDQESGNTEAMLIMSLFSEDEDTSVREYLTQN